MHATVEKNVLVLICWMVIMRKPVLPMKFKDVFGMVSCFVKSCLCVCILIPHVFLIGCLNCYARDTVNPVKGKTMHDLHQDTVKKAAYLKEHGFNMMEVWECQIKRELERDEEMKEYFNQYEMTDPLEPRHALYGGRTNAARLYHHCEGDEKIRYAIMLE
jgi:hypothetical protein